MLISQELAMMHNLSVALLMELGMLSLLARCVTAAASSGCGYTYNLIMQVGSSV